MATIPSISELTTSVENELRTQLGITRAWIGKVFLRCLAIVQAIKLKMLYLYIADIQKNIFVDTATSEQFGGALERFGRVKLQRDPLPAVSGEYLLDVTGATGGTIVAGALYKSNVNSTSPNNIYEVKSTVVLTGATGQVTVRALIAGSSSALIATDEVELVTPIVNVDSLATVDTVTVTPVNAEDLETYRDLIIAKDRNELQGGADIDYRVWSLDVQGVRTSYPYAKNGAPYYVQVFVEALPDDTAPGQPVGVAPSSMLTDVAAVIELDPNTTKPINERGRRPTGAQVEVLSVIPEPVTVTIDGLTDKSTATVTAIQTALRDLFYNIRPYKASCDAVKNDILYVSQIVAAVFGAIPLGESFTNITFEIDGNTYNSYTFGASPATYGNYPYLFSLVTP